MEKLVIQSDTKNIVDVERFISVVCDRWNINNYIGTISMSLLQAVENAIVHGNGNDIDKQVTITADSCKGGIYFVVEDEGAGFDYTSFGSMPMQEGSGTGIYLMKALSDRMSFTDGGRKVRLDFFISGIEATRALERLVTLREFYAPKEILV